MPESPLAKERQTMLKDEIKKVGYKPKRYSSIECVAAAARRPRLPP